jgi:hypothetical protein
VYKHYTGFCCFAVPGRLARKEVSNQFGYEKVIKEKPETDK